MADSTTTNLGLTKPEVGASSDTWGAKTNANFDLLDGLFGVGGTLLVSKGGTNAGTAAGARSNLGLGASDAVTFGGLTSNGAATVGAGSQALTLRPGATADEVYLALNARSATPAARSGYIGYGAPGTTVLSLVNELAGGTISLSAPSGVTVSSMRFTAQAAPVGALDVGFRGAPEVGLSGNYTPVLANAGCTLQYGLAPAITVTVPDNAAVPYPNGTLINLVTLNGPITISPAAGVDLRWGGTTLSGTRTLSSFGIASLYKVAANIWLISGAGLS